MTTVKFEVTGVTGVLDAISKASRVVPVEAAAVVERGALNIKRDWRKRWSGLKHAPALPAAITYDVYRSLSGPSAEIGPDKNLRQGALGNLVEYGSLKNSPRPGGAPALAAEEPRFVRALEDLSVKALGL